MGMEGKQRRISQFELASYRKTPSKLYADLFPSSSITLADFSKATSSVMDELQNSPLGQRIRQRALAGELPVQEDVEAYQREVQNVLKGYPAFASAMQGALPGITEDGKQISLHKSWSCMHFLFTGNGMEPDNSALGKAILGGAEIPDVNQVMGYGPVRFLLPAEVRGIHVALRDFPIRIRAEAYDPEKADAAQVYVPHHEAQELIQNFEWLREFYERAAADGEAVLLWIE